MAVGVLLKRRTGRRPGVLIAVPGLYDEEFFGFRVSSSDERDVALREAAMAIDANGLLGSIGFCARS